MKDPIEIYESNIKKWSEEEKSLLKKRFWLAFGRLFFILLSIFWLYNEWHKGWQIGLLGLLIGIIGFLFLVARDVNLKNRLLFIRQLLSINHKEVDGLHFKFEDWETGSNFIRSEHPYIGDLDIFGAHSLYQYINRCESDGGKKLLADYLSSSTDKTTIEDRQSAILELSNQTDWRQTFQAYGHMANIGKQMESDIHEWLNEPLKSVSVFWKVLIWLYPIITLSSVYLYLNDNISSSIFGLLMIVFILFSFSQSKKSNQTFEVLSRFYPKISKLQNLVACIEKMEINDSPLLKEIRFSCISSTENKASVSLKKLGKILGLFEARMNVFLFFFLNTFLLWDVRIYIGLLDWKEKYGHKILHWLSSVYQMDVYNSLATLCFNHPTWVFPKISSDYYHFNGKSVGHPLISDKNRVNNDFSIQGQGKMALITGSNMGGKSTFLRSLGVNMVLAYAGAPVCASFFEVSVAQLMSSMRIADNLAENTSTFYAELKKIRAIINAVNAKEKVFILLDEILRGTNSLDRHAGSKALMLQLIREKVVSVIATHDVELANLVTDNPDAITNYHFDVQVDNNEQLYFDYKLKSGICKRMNAAILMRQIGIEM